MSKNLLLLLVQLFSTSFSFAQQRYTLSGTVREASSNETLIGVTIAIPELKTGTTTNEYGFYSITVPSGEYKIVASYLGFADISQTVSLNTNTKLDLKMTEETQELEEVVLTEDVERIDIRKPQMSVINLAVCSIKQIPVVL